MTSREFNKILSDPKKMITIRTRKIIAFREALLYACTLLGPLATVVYEVLASELK
jgi:hypothetical protein